MPVSQEKVEYAERMNRLLDSYERILFINVDNVRSEQIHHVRRDIRGKGELLMGKNTLQRRILMNRGDDNLNEKLVESGIMTLNRGMLFTNEPVADIVQILNNHRIQAPARVGAVAPCDVIVPAGNTGMEPTMTSFFQALSIQTKIAKGTVEITVEKKVLKTGDKVDTSCAALLQKLKISPFYYQCEVEYIWDRGVVFGAEDLAMTDDVLEEKFLQGINNVNALSLGAGIPTEASFPAIVLDAFKNLLAISLETEYTFDDFNGAQLRADIKSGKVAAAAAPAAAASGKPAAAAVVEEEEEEEGEMEGLF